MEGWLAGFRRAGKIQLQGCMHLSGTHPRGASETVVPREKLRGAQKQSPWKRKDRILSVFSFLGEYC